jgi:hypothetical protein
MNLTLPTVSETPGPEYATQNNEAFEQVDSHDHTSGQGVPIPSAGINIDDDLPMNVNDLTEVRSVRFDNQPSALGAATDIGCIYSAGGNLYFNDVSGTQIQITAGGALNAASIGGIGGDYSTSSASVYYLSIDETFYFTSDTNTPATINGGSYIFREPVVSSNSITVKSPTSLAASYNVTWPTALPGSSKVVSITSAGALGTGVAGTVDSTDLATNSVSTIKIQDSAFTTDKINSLAVTTAKIDTGAVTQSKMASANSASATIGSFTTTSVAYVTTSLAVGPFTYTRPVMIFVYPNGSGVINGGTGGIGLAIDRSGVNIHLIDFPAGVNNTAGFVFPYFATGTYTFTIVARSVDASTVTFSNWGMSVLEMF